MGGGQVYIKDENVWLYTRWGASNLIKDVKSALKKRWRWDDSEYLTRIIFDEISKDCHGQETGFGISGNGKHGDVYKVIEIDCKQKNIKIIYYGNEIINMNFEEFINSDMVDIMEG